METHQLVVQELQTLLDGNPQMKSDLETSLRMAVGIANNGNGSQPPLDTDLYNAINNALKGTGWPTSAEEYYAYLDQYVRIIPDEEDDPIYPTAWEGWNSDGTKNGYNQKVYDLLCQFYWLVDQPIAPHTTMQSYEDFANWLVKFANAWGSYLDTPESLTPETLASFENDYMYNMDWYNKNRDSWVSFNTFFFREFNDAAPDTGLSPLRPIAAPDNNSVVVSPADCTFKAAYRIEDGKVISPPNERLKFTHPIGTVEELLADSEYADAFVNGTFVHYFLSPFDYHRFHTPVSGKMLEIRPVQGKVYLNVNMTSDGQFDAPDDAEADDTTGGYEFTQARGIIVVDTENPDIGKVAVLPIGMCQVSGVVMYDGTNDTINLLDENVVKGQEFGKFKFGGSDIIMLFEQPMEDLNIFEYSEGTKDPIHFKYGEPAVEI